MTTKEDFKFEVASKDRIVLIGMLAIPMLLLVLGVAHGLLQSLYRAGWIQSTGILGIEYYQGLTLHGVINAIVFTTFLKLFSEL